MHREHISFGQNVRKVLLKMYLKRLPSHLDFRVYATYLLWQFIATDRPLLEILSHHNLMNYMNPGYFTLAAIGLKPQQMPMFLHISARVWGRRWSPHTSEQKGCMLKPQYIN